MPDIDHVARSVRDAAILGILTRENEANEGVTIDPVCEMDQGQAAQDPPTVADIFFLFWTAVEPAPGGLPLAQPPAQLLMLDGVQPPGDAQRSKASEDLTRMRLGSGRRSVAAVKVGARNDVGDGLVDINHGQ